MKIGFLDIETTNLCADKGFILCASYKLATDKRVRTTRIDDFPGYRKCLYNDEGVVKQIRKWLVDDSPDFLVHYNGDFFDIPYIQSRLLLLNEKLMPSFRSVDHWKTSRYKLKLHSHSLDALARHVGCKNVKTWYDIKVWQAAAYGDKKALDAIVHHCEIDVRVLEEVHNKVVPLLRTLRGIM